MGWIFRNIEAMRRLPAALLLSHMSAKFILGLGVGFLIAGSFEFDFAMWGVVLIVLSIAVSFPSGRRILKDR